MENINNKTNHTENFELPTNSQKIAKQKGLDQAISILSAMGGQWEGEEAQPLTGRAVQVLRKDISALADALDSFIGDVNSANAGRGQSSAPSATEQKVLDSMHAKLGMLATALAQTKGTDASPREIKALQQQIGKLDTKIIRVSQEIRHLKLLNNWRSVMSKTQAALEAGSRSLRLDTTSYQPEGLSDCLSAVSMLEFIRSLEQQEGGVESLQQMRTELGEILHEIPETLENHIVEVEKHYVLSLQEGGKHIVQARQEASTGKVEALQNLALAEAHLEVGAEQLEDLSSIVESSLADVREARAQLVQLGADTPKSLHALDSLEQKLQSAQIGFTILQDRYEDVYEQNLSQTATMIEQLPTSTGKTVDQRMERLADKSELRPSDQLELGKVSLEIQYFPSDSNDLQERLEDLLTQFSISDEQLERMQQAAVAEYTTKRGALTVEGKKKAEKVAFHGELSEVEYSLNEQVDVLSEQLLDLEDMLPNYSSTSFLSIAKSISTLTLIAKKAHTQASAETEKASLLRVTENLQEVNFYLQDLANEYIDGLRADLQEAHAQYLATSDPEDKRDWMGRIALLQQAGEEALAVLNDAIQQPMHLKEGSRPSIQRIWSLLFSPSEPVEKVRSEMRTFQNSLQKLQRDLSDILSSEERVRPRNLQTGMSASEQLKEHSSEQLLHERPPLTRAMRARKSAKANQKESLEGWSERKKQFAWIAISFLYMGKWGKAAYDLPQSAQNLQIEAEKAASALRQNVPSEVKEGARFLEQALTDDLDELRTMSDSAFTDYVQRFPQTSEELERARYSAEPLTQREIVNATSRYVMQQTTTSDASAPTIGDMLESIYDEQNPLTAEAESQASILPSSFSSLQPRNTTLSAREEAFQQFRSLQPIFRQSP